MSKKLQDVDVHVTHEDQVKINSFAKNNAFLQDLKEEVELKKKTLQNLEDAEADAMMLDETDKIPYQTGEVFIHLQVSDAITKLDEDKKELLKEIADLESQMDKYKNILADLKVQLYAKFGNNINLEAGDE